MDKADLIEKAGRLLVVGFPGKTVTEDVKRLIHDYRVGQFILFGRNVGLPEELAELNANLQEEARLAGHQQPLLICIDQENGIVRRLKDPATAFPGAMGLGAANDLDLAKRIGFATGKELKEVGVNWNLAPVVDVNNNPKNPVINVRSFGESPTKVSELAVAWLKGCQDAGVATTLKHFPGHGDTQVDSHLDLPTIKHSLNRLFEVELIPFITGIKNGVDTIMSAHIYFSALETREGVPATLSRHILTGLLRERLGFDGVITTDCLEMKAIANTVGVANGAVEAIKAGADLAMISHTYEYQVNAIKKLVEALEQETLSLEQVLQSNKRIEALKNKYSSWEQATQSVTNIQALYAEHKALAEESYRKSVTIIPNKENSENIRHLDPSKKVLAVYSGNHGFLQVEEQNRPSIIKELINVYPADLDCYEVKFDQHHDDFLEKKVKDYDDIIVINGHHDERFQSFISPIVSTGKAVVLALRNPYEIRHFKDARYYVCVYDDQAAAIKEGLNAIYGVGKSEGKLPITIESNYFIK